MCTRVDSNAQFHYANGLMTKAATDENNAADKNFWTKLPRPIMATAPMANVTDAAFRRMFVECGKPDVFWTEFVSVEGLLSAGREDRKSVV